MPTDPCSHEHASEPDAPAQPFDSYYGQGIAAPARELDAPSAQPAARILPAENSKFVEIKRRLHERLIETLKSKKFDPLPLSEKRRIVRVAIEQLLDAEATMLNVEERKRLIDDLIDDSLGFGPIERLLRDGSISDILVNGPGQIYVERHGVLEETGLTFRDHSHLMRVIDRIVSLAGRHVDEASPMVDARLEDGSRVNAIVPPLSLRGATLSIRRFGYRPLSFDDLINLKTFPAELTGFLKAIIRGRLNILISGGTGSGKTTLLNTLSAFIPADERIITIEDAAELQLRQRHVVQLQSRPRNIEGLGEVTIHELLRNSLRMRPNRIVVGECRGPEVLDMLQAMNTGHDGSLTTLHANSPRDALARLEMMIMMSGFELPVKAMRQQITAALDLIIHTARLQGGPRKIMSVTELVGMEADTVVTQNLFLFRETGIDAKGRAVGQFEATGTRPTFLNTRLKALGIELPGSLFHERVIERDIA